VDAERRARLGARWTCTECGVAFYDLGKVEAVCPKCETKQQGQVAAKKKRPAKKPAGNYRRPLKQRAEPPPAEDDVVAESDDDDHGLMDEERDS
jgi:hypothetical protein